MIKLFKRRGTKWALEQLIGKKSLSILSIPKQENSIKEVAEKFSLSETGLMKLVANKLDILFIGDPEQIDPHQSLARFKLEELKSKQFVVYEVKMGSITLLCSDPSLISGICFKRENKSLQINLATTSTIFDLITKISETSINTIQAYKSSLPQIDTLLLWNVFDRVLQIVSGARSSSFELCVVKKVVNYSFVDSTLRNRFGDIDQTVGKELISMLTQISFQNASFERELKGSSVSCSITALTARKSVYVKFKNQGAISLSSDHEAYFTKAVLVESKVH